MFGNRDNEWNWLRVSRYTFAIEPCLREIVQYWKNETVRRELMEQLQNSPMRMYENLVWIGERFGKSTALNLKVMSKNQTEIGLGE